MYTTAISISSRNPVTKRPCRPRVSTHFLEDVLEPLLVQKVAFVEGEVLPSDVLDPLEGRGQAGGTTGHRVDEVVEGDDRVLRLQQLHGAVAADVSRTPRHEHRQART